MAGARAAARHDRLLGYCGLIAAHDRYCYFVDKERLTQVGRALARLGIEHIPVGMVPALIEIAAARRDSLLWGRAGVRGERLLGA
jgi:hypothetical protein